MLLKISQSFAQGAISEGRAAFSSLPFGFSGFNIGGRTGSSDEDKEFAALG